jgi:hypothetical protein
MKKFHFPLAQVMEWRRSRARAEEAKLERLHAELRGVEARAAQARKEQAQSESALLASASVTGAELASLDAFRKFVASECARLGEVSAECRKRIAKQMEAISQTRRDVRLIEKLHERKLAAWKAGLALEIDRQAEELYLAKWATELQSRRLP